MKFKVTPKKLIRFFILLFAVTLVITARNTYAKTSTYAEALKAYDKFLSQNTVYANDIEIDTKTCYFSIIDLDNNGIPELLLSGGGVLGCSAAPQALYTYYNGKVTYLATAGHDYYFGGFTKGNLIISGDTGEGYTTTDYNKIVNGKLKKVASSYDDSGAWNSQNIYKYWINNKKVTKKKFKEFLVKETGSSNPKRLELSYEYDNNDLNRKKYLSAVTTMSVSSVNLYEKESSQLYIYGTNSNIIWYSSNNKIVTVSATGKIKGIKKGNATIYGKTNGKVLKCKVKVISNAKLISKMIGTWTANEDVPGWETKMIITSDTITYYSCKIPRKYKITSLYKKKNKDIVIYYTVYEEQGPEKWKMIIRYTALNSDGSIRKPVKHYTQLDYYFSLDDGNGYLNVDLFTLDKKLE